MADPKKCAYVFKERFSKNEHPCQNDVYKDSKFCVFHHPDVKGKASDFKIALKKWISDCEEDENIIFYDFRGFIFPKISFIKKEFIKTADFCESQFSGNADFRESQFSGYAYFIESQFSGSADFGESRFSGDACFIESCFSGDADFSASRFSGDADFSESRFSGHAFFSDSHFSEDANFTDSHFSGSAYFSDSQFSKNADFSNNQISGDADFRDSHFSGHAYFSSIQISGDADFRKSRFSRSAIFRASQFSGSAYFGASHFSGSAYFSDSHFSGSAYFNNSHFSGGADFNNVEFLSISDFSNAEFHSILQFERNYIRLLKQLETKGVNFEGTIIEEANLLGIDKLENYSFQNAFLLSISFAERDLIDCDFTGAVMDAVRTRDWKPDEQTLKNTKFIYTDYDVITGVIDEETGRERTVYKPIEDSRVPASGFFGEGEHQNFTIADYLKERYRWSRAVNLPAPIRTAVLNYIQFFTDFIHVTEGLDIEIRTRQEGEKIRVEFLTETREDKEVIEKKFYEYLTKVQEADIENLDIKFSKKSKATQVQKDLLEIELKSQLRGLRDKLEYTGKLLESEKEKVNILRDVVRDRDLKSLLDSPPSQMQANFGFLKGDIVGFFSKYEVDERTAITEKLKTELEKTAEDCVFKEVVDGDSIKTIDSSAQSLAQVAVRITEDVEDKFPKKPKMRIAVDFGELTYEQSGNTFLVKGGEPLSTAARIEPCVTPGQVWCTEPFKSMLDETDGRFYAEEIQESEAPHLEYKDGKFNVKKKDSQEPDFYQKLYRIRKK